MQKITQNLIGAAALVLAFGFLNLAAANPQQEKMKACNAQAGDMKGSERQKFMSTCLSSGQSEALNPQQKKMKDCNAEAKGMKGDERKKFMSTCLAS